MTMIAVGLAQVLAAWSGLPKSDKTPKLLKMQ